MHDFKHRGKNDGDNDIETILKILIDAVLYNTCPEAGDKFFQDKLTKAISTAIKILQPLVTWPPDASFKDYLKLFGKLKQLETDNSRFLRKPNTFLYHICIIIDLIWTIRHNIGGSFLIFSLRGPTFSRPPSTQSPSSTKRTYIMPKPSSIRNTMTRKDFYFKYKLYLEIRSAQHSNYLRKVDSLLTKSGGGKGKIYYFMGKYEREHKMVDKIEEVKNLLRGMQLNNSCCIIL